MKLWKSGLLRVVCHEYRRSKRRCVTVREMKEGPSSSAIRSRSQATTSCCGHRHVHITRVSIRATWTSLAASVNRVPAYGRPLSPTCRELQDEANLLAQARFGIFAVLKALLDQNWMEERRERGVDCTRRFRGILKGYRREVQVYSATKPSMASRQLAHPTS